MNAQDYISSGLLEAYLLGGLSLTETEQVAGAVCRFPEVAAELARLEADILQAAEQDAVAPPPGLDDKIWAAIQNTSADAAIVNGANVTPAPVQKPPTKVISLDGSRSSAGRSWAKAAVWAALIGSAMANIVFFNQQRSTRSELADLRGKTEAMDRQQTELTASLDRYKHEADMMAQPGMMPVPMLSTQPGHPMAATFYWDKKKQEAYVSVQKLPPAPTGMQYQLWAIVDGKPVDMGMLENDVVAKGGMQKVPKQVMAGEAFAVSLEKAGGNPEPTPDKIFLLGKMPQA